MLVDDNVSFRERLARFLRLHDDLEVVAEAGDGLQAIERARQALPDVILIDFRMPRLDGYTAARRIIEESPTTKVFILTAYPGALDPEKMARAGIELLVKDLAPSLIVNAIRRVVTSSQPT
ncbi:MAG: response regulator transcription factor [Armatimonadetes bacterium]|nr:response regulator transcription factor [Armatimonadota bacterium]